jgi:hypothetical protein
MVTACPQQVEIAMSGARDTAFWDRNIRREVGSSSFTSGWFVCTISVTTLA